MHADPPKAEPGHIVTMLTTEHFALQGARSAALADAQSRSTIFLTSLSSALVALAFVGQSTKMGEPFYVFAYIMFATLYVMGVVTFLRVAQTAVEDSIHARGINRIRHYYLEIAPQLAPYFIHSIHDDMRGMIADMGVVPNRWQTYLTSSSMLAFIASVMLGVLAGFVARAALGAPVGVGLVASVAFGAANFSVLQHVATRLWDASERRFPARFPSS